MVIPDRDTLLAAPKVLLHDHLDGGVRPATVIALADEPATRCPPPTPSSWRSGSTAAPPDLDLVLYLEAFNTRSASCRPRTPCTASPPSARRTSPPTAWSTPRCASPPSCTSRPASTLDAVVEAVLAGFRDRQQRQGHRPCAPAHGHAPGRPLARDRRARRALSRRRRGRVRHRRRRGRLPADPPPRRLPARDAGRTSTSPSTPARRSGCRPSGRPCSSAAPSGSDMACASSTTSPSAADGTAVLGRPGRLRPRPPLPARDVPHVQRAHRRGPSIAEHPIGLLRDLRFRVTVNTDNRLMSDRHHDRRVRALSEAFGWTLARLRSGSPSTP